MQEAWLFDVGAGGAVALLGAAVWLGDVPARVAGYDAERVTDESALTAFVGRWVVLVGALLVAMGLFGSRRPLPDSAWVGYAGVVLVVCCYLAYGSRRYEA
ncbi:DUF3784 domain-containing protein [Halomarina ordinaria]|uniref:DUF3784 domain-containing protein n=1 Tax=Halomarina ordinaria TaxID=3033939 RepID=A0ABD5U7X3_9EURY